MLIHSYPLLFIIFFLNPWYSVTFGESFGLLSDDKKNLEFAVAFDDILQINIVRIMNPFWRITERFDRTKMRAIELQKYSPF